MAEPLHTFKLPRGPRAGTIRRVGIVLESLPPDRDYELTLVERKRNRSLSQNALLWSLYQQIIDKGGEAMRGWEREDLHTFFLGNFHGWDKVELFGAKRLRPMGRSHNLSRTEFVDYVDSIVRFMAERGVVLDMPDDARAA